MKEEITAKIYRNKRNNQITIILPKKKLKRLKKSTPKKVKISIERWLYK